jgi:hypothetical protein
MITTTKIAMASNNRTVDIGGSLDLEIWPWLTRLGGRRLGTPS